MTIETLVNDYKAKTSRSRQMYEEALQVMPGGNSRTTTFFDPYPFYITRGAGPRIWDADGAERLDFNGNYTSLILGHAHASVVEAVTEQATRGMSFPGPSEHEVKLDRLRGAGEWPHRRRHHARGTIQITPGQDEALIVEGNAAL